MPTENSDDTLQKTGARHSEPDTTRLAAIREKAGGILEDLQALGVDNPMLMKTLTGLSTITDDGSLPEGESEAKTETHPEEDEATVTLRKTLDGFRSEVEQLQKTMETTRTQAEEARRDLEESTAKLEKTRKDYDELMERARPRTDRLAPVQHTDTPEQYRTYRETIEADLAGSGAAAQ